MTNQIIEVPDISVIKTVNGEKRLFSLHDQKVKKDSLHVFGIGSGVKYQGDLYVLDNGNIPIVRMTTAKADPSFSVVRSGDIEVDWGDGVREINKFEYTYADGIDNHDIVFYGKNTTLKELWCGMNQLTSICISKSIALLKLDCCGNPIQTLDVSQNFSLISLHCASCQLTSLDISHNIALSLLNCSENALHNLDISHNTSLEFLSCLTTELTFLDISRNLNLKELNCSNNHLTVLDVTKNVLLERLNCEINDLISLDVSQNNELIRLDCVYTRLIDDDQQLLALVNSLPNRIGKTAGLLRTGKALTANLDSIIDNINWENF